VGSRSVCRALTAGDGGDPPLTAKTRALTQVNPFRPRYTKTTAANLPERAKPVIGGEATSKGIRRAVRGDWGGRVSKDGRRNLGDPTRSPPSG